MNDNAPLADMLRPKTLGEIVGQSHLFADNAPISVMVSRGRIRSMIFHGPPGIGKTTAAEIIASLCGKQYIKLNGTTAGMEQVKAVISEANDSQGILLYLDEIQYWNKKQQQSMLEYIEDGRITLIASTTENPYFYVYGALLSRCAVFEFKPVAVPDIEKAIARGVTLLQTREEFVNVTLTDEARRLIAQTSGGDVRKALNLLEFAFMSALGDEIDDEAIVKIAPKAAQYYDRDGDEHFDLLSALHKSIRGSDENAALFYLAKLISGGDIVSPIRRILCAASEDIGLAHPMAAVIVKSLCDSAVAVGLPEARLMLAEAVIYLCTCPKSNSGVIAIDSALADIESGAAKVADIPIQLKNLQRLKDDAYLKSTGGARPYLYPHDYKNHYVKQNYLPDSLLGKEYYTFGDNKTEQAAKAYREKILGEDSTDI
ncbi:ATPase AAA [Clostridia bacterium]|nr:ATPase AAA [Clostridia bacterium]